MHDTWQTMLLYTKKQLEVDYFHETAQSEVCYSNNITVISQ